MKKLAVLAAGVAIIPSLMSVSAFADSPGQLASGTNLYNVRNVTTNGNYAGSASATCGDTIKYRVELSNTDYGQLKNVTVNVPLSGAVKESATNAADATVTSTGAITVTTDKGTLTYVAGSTQLQVLDNTNKVLSTSALPDGITTGNLSLADLEGSTNDLVTFQATVKCDTPTTPVTPVTPVTPTAPTIPAAPATPAALPSTGTGDMILPAVGLAAMSAAAVYAVRARRSL